MASWPLLALLLAACGPSEPEPRVAPYVTQRGCEFTLVLPSGNSTSAIAERGSADVTYRLSMGGERIGISDCRLVENPGELRVFSD